MKKIACLLAVALFGASCAEALAQVTLFHTERGAFINPLLPTGAVSTAPDGFRAAETPGDGDNFQIRALNSTFPTPGGPPVASEHNFHTFDLSATAGVITSATLRIFAEEGSYDTTAASETLAIFDVSTPASVLADPLSNPTLAGNAFVDLGSGTLLGTATITPADDNSFVDIILNTAAINELNDAVGIGLWSAGGTLATFSGDYAGFGLSERVFQSETGPAPSAQLVLTGSVISVPEPASAMLAMLACGFLARRTRR